MITVPAVENSARRPSEASAVMRTDTVWPRASAICEATVRFQIRSYSLNSSPEQLAADLVRRAEAVAGRTDRLVRLLRVLHLPLVPARLRPAPSRRRRARGPGRAQPSAPTRDSVVESVRM